ncbi:porin [Phreatobacter cathodiphilus]|uniref:Porin n=2 Tax=Phreatobacter cathodiphilus TaxID=1868589 RepID=A0A2S0NB37_9HYPH|nr:porin [Phreatobacter cathodiphilus]
MKTVKSLLLGAAAGFIGLTGAQAADLPGKAAPAEYVRICDTYGAGFFFIPGTDTCLRIGGYVRHESYLAQQFSPATNVYSTRTRLLLNFDARSNTEYGLLRAYGEFFVQRGPGGNALPGAYVNVATGQGSTVQASATYMSRAFIQFAGFTFGNSASFFNFYQGDVQFVTAAGAAFDPARGSSNLIAYTASFGSGFSATISVEDPQFKRIGSLPTVPGGVWTPASQANGVIYNGNGIPDVVGNLRVDQGWGSAQIMAAYHEVRTTNAGIGRTAAGWAVGGGVRLNLDMLARGDVLWLQAAYGDGALGYVAHNDNSDGLIQTRQQIGVGLLTATYADGALNAAGTGIVNTKAWSVHAGFRHFWTPALRSAIWGKYVDVNAPSVANSQGVNLNDIRFWQVGVNTIWSPVRNLDLGIEVVYSNLRSRDTVGGGAVNGTTIGTQGAWSGVFRAQRNF